jgi:hypothetical protein
MLRTNGIGELGIALGEQQCLEPTLLMLEQVLAMGVASALEERVTWYNHLLEGRAPVLRTLQKQLEIIIISTK